MADSLEFPEVFEENRGSMYSGKLKLTSGAITFKNSKTGKLDQYQSNDVKAADWLKRARGFCLKLRLENDLIHRYDGFTEQVSVSWLSQFRHFKFSLLDSFLILFLPSIGLRETEKFLQICLGLDPRGKGFERSRLELGQVQLYRKRASVRSRRTGGFEQGAMNIL